MCYFACQQMFSSHLCLITSVNQLEIIPYVRIFTYYGERFASCQLLPDNLMHINSSLFTAAASRDSSRDCAGRYICTAFVT